MSEFHQGKVVAQYRKLRNWSQQDLADELHVDTRTVQRIEQQAMIKDINRRKFLVALLGIPASLMALDEEVQRGQIVERAEVAFNDDPMSFLEDQMQTRWEIHLIGGPIRAAHGVYRWLTEVDTFAASTKGTAWNSRALSLLCMSYQLEGSVSGDMMHYQKAHLAYQHAYRIAQELEDLEMMAAVRVRQAIVYMRQEKIADTLVYLNNAFDIIQGHGYQLLKGNILQVRSEAYAKAQQKQECWRSIGLAENMLQYKSQLQEHSYRLFTLASVTAHKGTDALLLHDYERAISLFDKSLTTYNPTLTPGRARLLARKAEAFYGLGEIDTCVAIAEEALSLTHAVGANNTLTRIKDLHISLQQSLWKKERSVARLGAAIVSSH